MTRDSGRIRLMEPYALQSQSAAVSHILWALGKAAGNGAPSSVAELSKATAISPDRMKKRLAWDTSQAATVMLAWEYISCCDALGCSYSPYVDEVLVAPRPPADPAAAAWRRAWDVPDHIRWAIGRMTGGDIAPAAEAIGITRERLRRRLDPTAYAVDGKYDSRPRRPYHIPAEGRADVPPQPMYVWEYLGICDWAGVSYDPAVTEDAGDFFGFGSRWDEERIVAVRPND